MHAQLMQVGAAVNVICELAKNNPKNYIRLVSACALSLTPAPANDRTHALGTGVVPAAAQLCQQLDAHQGMHIVHSLITHAWMDACVCGCMCVRVRLCPKPIPERGRPSLGGEAVGRPCEV